MVPEERQHGGDDLIQVLLVLARARAGGGTGFAVCPRGHYRTSPPTGGAEEGAGRQLAEGPSRKGCMSGGAMCDY